MAPFCVIRIRDPPPRGLRMNSLASPTRRVSLKVTQEGLMCLRRRSTEYIPTALARTPARDRRWQPNERRKGSPPEEAVVIFPGANDATGLRFAAGDGAGVQPWLMAAIAHNGPNAHFANAA